MNISKTQKPQRGNHHHARCEGMPNSPLRKKSISNWVPRKTGRQHNLLHCLPRGHSRFERGQPAEDLHLAFSTGSVIDWSQNWRKSKTNWCVANRWQVHSSRLHQDTFNIFKHKPCTLPARTKKESSKSPTWKMANTLSTLGMTRTKIYRFKASRRSLVFTDTMNLTTNIDSL